VRVAIISCRNACLWDVNTGWKPGREGIPVFTVTASFWHLPGHCCRHSVVAHLLSQNRMAQDAEGQWSKLLEQQYKAEFHQRFCSNRWLAICLLLIW
jgi:hypothetical protein